MRAWNDCEKKKRKSQASLIQLKKNLQTTRMNDFLRFALIIGVLLVVFYFINGSTASSVVPNAGALSMDMEMPASQYQGAHQVPGVDDNNVEDPYQEPIPGSPETAVGGSVDRLNWDGLGETQIQGALTHQYQDLTGEDLLPHNDIAHFAEVYPNGVGQLQNKNYLHAGHHVGINTIGQSLKNPNYQIRSEVPNPQTAVSPWLQSSYGPDLTRRPMDISETC